MKKLIAAAGFGAAIATTVALAPSANAYENFYVCPSGRSGVATTVTSCAFADNVRYSYLHENGHVVTAYSPVTEQFYNMQCGEGFVAELNNGATVRSARCVGGNNAVVIVW
jgi:hypothetical protein